MKRNRDFESLIDPGDTLDGTPDEATLEEIRRIGIANDGFANDQRFDGVQDTTRASANSSSGSSATGTTSSQGVAKKSASELIGIINSNPNSLNLNDIDFTNQALVNEVIAALAAKVNAGSGANRYEMVLPNTVSAGNDANGNPIYKPAGVYDRISGRMVQALSDTTTTNASAQKAVNDLTALINAGESQDLSSAKGTMKAAQGALGAGITAVDTENGYKYLDRLMGGDYQKAIGSLSGVLGKTSADMDGLTSAEKAMYERQNALAISKEEASALRQLDGIRASTGSTMAFLASADEIRSRISDMRVSQQVEMMNADIARKDQAYQQKSEQYFSLLQQGQITIKDYQDGLRADRLNAFNAAAQVVSQIAASDQNEVENLKALADTLYSKLTFETTQNSAAYKKWTDLADSIVKPWSDLLETIMDMATLQATN